MQREDYTRWKREFESFTGQKADDNLQAFMLYINNSALLDLNLKLKVLAQNDIERLKQGK